MDVNDSLVIKFWKNPESQIFQIEKEILLPQIDEKRRFLEDYKQALHEFLDVFESSSFIKERNAYNNVSKEESESLASMLFKKYSFWNKECDSYDVQLWEECGLIESNLNKLKGLSTIQSQMSEFMQLYIAADSINDFIDGCIKQFSLSSSQIEFVLSMSLFKIKDLDLQSVKDEIEIDSAIDEFIKRLSFGYWQRTETEGAEAENNYLVITYHFDITKQVWKKHTKLEEKDNLMINYFFNTEENNWEKLSKLEFEPSFNSYIWDKQNEKWLLEENYDIE